MTKTSKKTAFEAAHEITRSHFSNAESHYRTCIEGLEDQGYWNGWSNFSRAVAIECLFAAATMGAASLVAARLTAWAGNGAKWLRGITEGSKLMTSVANGTINTTKFMIRSTGRLPTLGGRGAGSAKLMEAAFGMYGRLTVGTLIFAIKEFSAWLKSDDKKQSPNADWGMGYRFAAMAILSIVAAPAPKVQSGRIISALPGWLSLDLQQLPKFAPSRQLILQCYNIAKGTSKSVAASVDADVEAMRVLDETSKKFVEALREPETDELWSAIDDAPDVFGEEVQKVADEFVSEFIGWALEEEKRLEESLGKEVAKVNFVSKLSWNNQIGMTAEGSNFFWKSLDTLSLQLNPLGPVITRLRVKDSMTFDPRKDTDNASAYNYLCRTLVVSKAKARLWAFVQAKINEVEQTLECLRIQAKARGGRAKARAKSGYTSYNHGHTPR